MSIHEILGIWKSLDYTLQTMKTADVWCLDDTKAFYILTKVAAICSFDTYMEFWRDILCVNVSPDFIVHIWSLCGENPDEFVTWVADLYDNYAIIIPFGGV